MTKRITFTFQDGNPDNAPEFPIYSTIEATHEFDENSTWDVVMDAFVKFLGHAWGYDISDKVDYDTLQERLDKFQDEWNDLYEDEDCGDPDCPSCNQDK